MERLAAVKVQAFVIVGTVGIIIASDMLSHIIDKCARLQPTTTTPLDQDLCACISVSFLSAARFRIYERTQRSEKRDAKREIHAGRIAGSKRYRLTCAISFRVAQKLMNDTFTKSDP